jgi:hypothetical protein
MRIFFTVFAFLTLVHFFASVVEVPAVKFYVEGVKAYCTGDICK